MELAASIVLFAAASLIVVAAFYLLRTDRMSWRSQKLVLGVKLPKLGESGSITEAQTHELLEKGVITPYQTWLSTEQAALLLECGAYVDATWSRLMGMSGQLPKEAYKAGLKIVLTHGSYVEEARVWVKHESFDIDPPNDPCAHQLTAVLNQWLSLTPEPAAQREPVSA
jgi:hypothetical protein